MPALRSARTVSGDCLTFSRSRRTWPARAPAAPPAPAVCGPGPSSNVSATPLPVRGRETLDRPPGWCSKSGPSPCVAVGLGSARRSVAASSGPAFADAPLPASEWPHFALRACCRRRNARSSRRRFRPRRGALPQLPGAGAACGLIQHRRASSAPLRAATAHAARPIRSPRTSSRDRRDLRQPRRKVGVTDAGERRSCSRRPGRPRRPGGSRPTRSRRRGERRRCRRAARWCRTS